MLYTSTQNNKIKELKKLNNKKYRDLNDKFLIEGEHLIEEAYHAGYLEEIYLLEGTTISLDVPKFLVTQSVMKFISELETVPKMIGVCKKIDKYNELGNSVLILDNIQDPGNLGTIIRSSVAFKIDSIIVSSDTVDMYNSKVIRASQGMIFHTNIVKKDLELEIPYLKQNGYRIYATNVKNGKELKNIEKCEKFAIIMGNEGAGVKEAIASLADEYLYISMSKDCESLNVAVATSIILYELSK